MSQEELERQISRATGESLRTIRRRGFSILDPNDRQEDFEVVRNPLVVDWDALEERRRAA